MYSGLLNYCLREATSALRQNKLACRTPLPVLYCAFCMNSVTRLRLLAHARVYNCSNTSTP